MKKYFTTLCFGGMLLMATSCGKKGCTDPLASNYDSKAKKDDGTCIKDQSLSISALLKDIGDEIILPRYETLSAAAVAFNEAIISFTDSISPANLSVAQVKLLDLEMAWQKCSAFEFGPAEAVSLRSHVNTFPTDTALIEEKISAGNYDLSSFLAVSYKGLPALDYLLHSGQDSEILLEMEGSNNRKVFLKDLSAALSQEIAAVYSQWKVQDGNYIQDFKNALGTDINSSLSLLVNQFSLDYELLKNAKIGIPLGKQTLGQELPHQVEAYYSGQSLKLSQKSLEGLYYVYIGKGENGENKNGFQDYLIGKNKGTLSNQINDGFITAISALENVPDPLSEAITSNKSLVETAYDELKKLVLLIKSEMAGEMEVTITYSDGDGD